MYLFGKKALHKGTQENTTFAWFMYFYSVVHDFFILKLLLTCLIAFSVTCLHLGSFRDCAVVRRQQHVALYSQTDFTRL